MTSAILRLHVRCVSFVATGRRENLYKMKRMDDVKRLLPRWLYYVLGTLITCFGLWGVSEMTGIASSWRQSDARRMREYLPPSHAVDRMMAIQNAALKDPDYGPEQYIRDMREIRMLGHRTSSVDTQRFYDVLKDRLDKLAIARYAKELRSVPVHLHKSMVNDYLRPHLMHAQYKYAEPGLTVPKILSGLWFMAKFGMLIGLLIAWPILLLRVLAHCTSLAQAIALYRKDWREILIAAFFWVIGLSEHGYDPGDSWVRRVAEQADRGDQTVPYCERRLLAEAQLLSKGESILAIWRWIWRPINWRQFIPDLRSLRTRQGRQRTRVQLRQARRQVLTATYLSVVATVYVVCGYKIALAAEPEKQEVPPVRAVAVVSTVDPRQNFAPSEHVFLFGGDGKTTLVLLGFTGPDPLLELSHDIFKLRGKAGDASVTWTGGPFINAAFERGRGLRAYGITSFFNAKSGRLSLSGPIYGALGTTGSPQLSLWAPGTNLFYRLTDRLSIGIGAAFFASPGSTPNLAIGPAVQYDFDPRTTLRLRYTNGGTGVFEGQRRLRLDLVKRF